MEKEIGQQFEKLDKFMEEKIEGMLKQDMKRVIVFSRNKPIFDVRPLGEKDMVLEKLVMDVASARADYAAHKTFTPAQVRKTIGIKK